MKIADIIKYEGDNSTFIWKHPLEDFNTMTQLIVHESQEAIFFMNGQAFDLFGPGRYTLETQNIPKLGGILNRLTGSEKPFHCEVYFINQTVQMGIKWGTDSKVRYIDSMTGVPLELGASGEMNLQVSDSRKLLIKLVGTMNGIAWNESGSNFTKSLQQSFRPLISTAIKSHLTSAIKAQNINILEIDEHLEDLSTELRSRIVPGFEEYGLTIPQFYLTTVILPEDDPNFKKIRELYTVSLQKRVMEAEAEIRTAKIMTEAGVKTAQVQAEADVSTLKAQREAEIIAAQRTAELEKQTTETEIARREAERTVIEAQAQAHAMKAEGFAEAEIMRAKGYTEKDIIQADVQKAYAEGIGNMGGSGNAGGSAMSDIVGLGIGLQAANAMGNQLSGIFGGTSPVNMGIGAAAPNQQGGIICSGCGNELPENAKFCLNCGAKVERMSENEMICLSCGSKTPKGKFCIECGAPLANNCPKCGTEIPTGGKFCLNCGEKLV